MSEIERISVNTLLQEVKDYENSNIYSVPLKRRLKTSKLQPMIDKLTDTELKALLIILSSNETIKVFETLHQGRYSSIQRYIINKELIKRSSILKIGVNL